MPAPPSDITSAEAFDQAFDLSRLAKRLVSEDGMRDTEFALAAIHEYKRFFCLLIESDGDSGGDVAYLPSAAVDKVWQRHLLDTQQYFLDCEEYDMPGGYLHRHELWSAASWPQQQARAEAEWGGESPASVAALSVDATVAQTHYLFTKAAYKEAYGEAPREDLWPALYEYTGPTGGHRKVNSDSGDKYISYALPQATLPADTHTLVSHSDPLNYTLPSESELLEKLHWVGELVFDSLPAKQAVCGPGEAVCRIAFSADVQRVQAVALVVREYVRFLLLLMQKKHGMYLRDEQGSDASRSDTDTAGTIFDFGPSAELTPSKLVDECWHAHVLCSPAYFQFCTRYGPGGAYIHHFPHFDKPHNYHVPGFKATLRVYQTVFGGEPPAKEVWGVLGESGGCGGCGGGCGGGDGGGGGGDCGGGGCSGFGGRNAPKMNYMTQGFGALCGEGDYYASCGGENMTDPSDTRPVYSRPTVPNARPNAEHSIVENGAHKKLCDINIFNLCLNKYELNPTGFESVVTESLYFDTYTKPRNLFKGPRPKPIEFMGEGYVTGQLFAHWQQCVRAAMQERYAAAAAVSQLQAGASKDLYWQQWKRSVQSVLTLIVAHIRASLDPSGLDIKIQFVNGGAGEIYFGKIDPRKFAKRNKSQVFFPDTVLNFSAHEHTFPLPASARVFLPPGAPYAWRAAAAEGDAGALSLLDPRLLRQLTGALGAPAAPPDSFPVKKAKLSFSSTSPRVNDDRTSVVARLPIVTFSREQMSQSVSPGLLSRALEREAYTADYE
jgi:hypothetical protein